MGGVSALVDLIKGTDGEGGCEGTGISASFSGGEECSTKIGTLGEGELF